MKELKIMDETLLETTIFGEKKKRGSDARLMGVKGRPGHHNDAGLQRHRGEIPQDGLKDIGMEQPYRALSRHQPADGS